MLGVNTMASEKILPHIQLNKRRMLFFKRDVDRAINTIHNSGFVRAGTSYARIEVFDKLVKLKGNTCYYFTDRGYLQPKNDFLQLPETLKTLKIKVDLYTDGDTEISVFKIISGGATRCLVVDDLETREEESFEIRLFKTLSKNGVI